MSANAGIPSVLPVEFTERLVYLLGELGAMRPQLGAVVTFDGILDEPRLRRALRLMLDAEPVLACRFEPDSKPPVWRRLDHIDEGSLLRLAQSSDPAADATSFVAESFDPRQGPQVLGALFRGEGGDTLAIKTAHVAVDGGALKEMLYLLGEAYRSLDVDPNWEPEPNLNGVRSPRAKAGYREWFAALRQSRVVAPPTDWGDTDFVGDGSAAYLSSAVEPMTFRAAAEQGRTVGATVNDIILTAYYRVLWRLLDPAAGDRTPLQVSCELRKHLPEGTKTALSNISSAWSISLSRIEGEAFDATLKRVVESTTAWKRSGAGRAGAIAMPLLTSLTRRQGLGSLRKQMVKGFSDATSGKGYPTLTNIGIIDEGDLDFGGPRIADAWLLGPIGSEVVLTASTYRDRLHLTLGAEAGAIEKHSRSKVVDEVAGEIDDWVNGYEGARRQTS